MLPGLCLTTEARPFVFLISEALTEAYSTATLRKCVWMRVSSKSLQRKWKKCVWKLSTHTCVTVYALDTTCVCACTCMHMCVWTNPSPLAPRCLCQADRATWESNHLRLPRRPDRQTASNSFQLSRNGKDDPEMFRANATAIQKNEGWRSNDSNVRCCMCKMVLS